MRTFLIALIAIGLLCALKPVPPAAPEPNVSWLIPDVPDYHIEITPTFTEEATLIGAGLTGAGTAVKVQVPTWPDAHVKICFDLARLNLWQCVYTDDDGHVFYRSIKPSWDRT